MVMPNRSFSAGAYRFGFNGKENDNEIKGLGNSVDFGDRIDDVRLGRFLSIDPLAKKFPSESNYIYAGCNPVFYVDKNGDEKVLYVVFFNKQSKGDTKLTSSQQKEIILKTQQIINKNNIDVKVIGLLSDHTLDLSKLDKSDNVVYVADKSTLNEKNVSEVYDQQGHRSTKTEEGWVSPSWFKGELSTGYMSDVDRKKLQKQTGESQDKEGRMSIGVIHEGLGHVVVEGHLNYPTNLMVDGDVLQAKTSPFPFELNSPLLYFLPETRGELQEIYGEPKKVFKGIPFLPDYQNSGTDNYTKRDKSVDTINK